MLRWLTVWHPAIMRQNTINSRESVEVADSITSKQWNSQHCGKCKGGWSHDILQSLHNTINCVENVEVADSMTSCNHTLEHSRYDILQSYNRTQSTVWGMRRLLIAWHPTIIQQNTTGGWLHDILQSYNTTNQQCGDGWLSDSMTSCNNTTEHNQQCGMAN